MDPETKRVQELTRRVRDGEASDAEREELALYVEDKPEVQSLVVRADQERELGAGWLARSEADKRIVAAETTPYTKFERRLGVGLIVSGGLGSFLFPPAFIAVLAGGAVLTWSVLRVKLKTLGKDPSKDIEQ